MNKYLPSSISSHISMASSSFSTFWHQTCNASQPHILSFNCGLAAAIPNYTSHHIIHRNHVLWSASMRHQHLVWDGSRSGISKSYDQARPIMSSSAGPTCSQHRGRAENPIQSITVDQLNSTGQRRSVGVAGPNFREKLRRFLAIKNAHISGLEDRIQTLERKNGYTLLDVWKFNCKNSRLKRQLRCEVFRLKIERSFILLLLLFL